MRILFLHNNFPAQYRNLAPLLASDKNNQVVFGTMRKEGTMPNIVKAYYEPARKSNPKTHHYLHNAESAVLHGQAVFRMCVALKRKGFVPEVICGHSGWGPPTFLKEVFPNAKVLTYFEWYYNACNSDFDFFKDHQHSDDDYCRLRIKNTALLHDLVSCDQGLSPTQWQWSQLPEMFKPKVTVLHDGVNTDFMVPDPNAVFMHDNLKLTMQDEVVTYVARGMEEYRGFPQFIQAIEILLKQRPNTRVVIVGEDRVAYGRSCPQGKTFKQLMLEQCKLDLSRVHFVGILPYQALKTLFQISSVHVYLTVPFVLSWSMLEAMSAGCLLLGSATAPVQEIIEDGQNGLLVDFFDSKALAEKLNEILSQPEKYSALRLNARNYILENYSYRKLLPKHIELIKKIAAM